MVTEHREHRMSGFLFKQNNQLNTFFYDLIFSNLFDVRLVYWAYIELNVHIHPYLSYNKCMHCVANYFLNLLSAHS
jgi:hypothetical protein